MNFKIGFWGIVWFMIMLRTPMTASCRADVPDDVQYRYEGQQKSLLSQDDLEIIKDLDFLENLPLLSEDDFSLSEESDFVADQQ